jgi:Mg2+ and Co2+ transporter CorA
MDVWLVSDEGVEQRSVEELQLLLQRKDRLVWVDIPECDEQATQVLTEVFGFHPLAIGDCVERNQAPKIHPYSGHLFSLILRAVLCHHRGRDPPPGGLVAALAREAGLLEQQVMSGEIGDPEQFLEELFRARHELLVVRTMAGQSREV